MSEILLSQETREAERGALVISHGSRLDCFNKQSETGRYQI